MYRAIGIKRKIILCLFKTKHKVRIQLQRYSLKYTSSLFIHQKSNVQKITEIMEEDLYSCLTLSVTRANSNADKIYTMQNNTKALTWLELVRRSTRFPHIYCCCTGGQPDCPSHRNSALLPAPGGPAQTIVNTTV